MSVISKIIFRTKKIIQGNITLSSTSILASWSPTSVVNPGTTLDWTVSGGVTIATTTINDPTFNFSTNTGTANVLIENAEDVITLDLRNLSIITIDLSNISSLDTLICSINSLTSIDVGQNTLLTELELQQNSLNGIDVSQNTLLTKLVTHTNPLSTLDVSQNTLLTELQCSNNSLSTLDISNNTLLIVLACQFNSFSSTVTNQILADLVSNNQNNGTLFYRNNETGQGITDRATLITRSWTIINFGS